MVFEPFRDVWGFVKGNSPGSPFKKRHLSFITIHYIYIGCLAILGSILIYPAHGIAYIDALFLATGAATQSGLNTVDINKLNTYQQVVLHFLPMFATPIFINTMVVFVRLYWFEKRFQHIVKEAQNLRRSRGRSRTNTMTINDKDLDGEEKGVNGRSITVLHGGNAKKDLPNVQSADPIEPEQRESKSTISLEDIKEVVSTPSSPADTPDPNTVIQHQRDITFADELPRPSGGERYSTSIYHQADTDKHIEFLENQRNPRDKGTLRIPGPREYDRGVTPEIVPEHENESSSAERRRKSVDRGITSNVDIYLAHVHPSGNGIENLHGKVDSSHIFGIKFRKTAWKHGQTTPTLAPSSSLARPRSRSGTTGSLKASVTRDNESAPYLSWQPTIGRNSTFFGLTEEQRDELGGIEYRSLKTLTVLLVSYYISFHFLGIIVFLPWILRTNTWGSIVDADGQSRVWWGIFTPASMLNDVGFTLTPDSMISFQLAVVPLLLGAFLIVIGNTGFPCMLRFIIWSIWKMVPSKSGYWEELKFLLDHPRRCFTLLFPEAATWWLFWILVFFNGVDLLFFIVLDLNDSTVTSINPVGFRVLDGLFQAVSTRTAGLSVVDLANLHPAIQVSYLVMMYVSVFPIAISVRRTNVYEEKSLGIYASSGEENEDEKEPSYVGAHLRRQLSFDLWYLFLGLFVVAIAEAGRIEDPSQPDFSLFACLFEVVSAYGTVGLSLGYPNINASFSAEFGVVAKLVIISMQIRGRHRGLPYELDRAVLLPSENLHKKEDHDAAIRMNRRASNASAMRRLSDAH